jgi:mannitol/fructose-specific phosphotransferase system IIA component (Ntr-type)
MSAEPSGFLQSLIDRRLVFTGLEAASLEEALAELSRRISAAGVVHDAADLTRRLLERERLGCTGLGGGIAIPHCKLKEIDEIVLSVASFPRGVDFAAPDGIPVTLVFLILSPAQAPALHLQALARISRLMKTPGVVDALRSATTSDELVAVLREAESAAVPAGRS